MNGTQILEDVDQSDCQKTKLFRDLKAEPRIKWYRDCLSGPVPSWIGTNSVTGGDDFRITKLRQNEVELRNIRLNDYFICCRVWEAKHKAEIWAIEMAAL